MIILPFSSRDAPDMVSISFGHCLGLAKRIGAGIALTWFLFGGFSGSLMAQSHRDSDSRFNSDRLQRRSQDRQSSANLPDWAEPSGDRLRNPGRFSRSESGGAQANAAPPDPPDAPSRIPVDGGVALLAAAGAGYAVRKLNEEDDGEEPA